MSYRRQRANANRHTERGLAALDQSVKADGWIGAVTVAADGETFDGSARLEVGPGFDDPIVIESDGSRPVILVRSDIPSADDPRAVRLGLAANRVAQLNLDWDPDVLSGIGADMDLSSLWDDDELAALMPDHAPGDGGDEFDTTPEDGPTRVQPGDLWQLGRHRLLCGDSTKREDVERLMDGERADAVVSDPPYGMRLDTSFSFSKGNEAMAIKATKGYAPVVGDDADFDVSWLFETFSKAKEVFLFGADYYVDTLPRCGKDGSWMVWDKKNEALRNVLGLADFELIWSQQRHKRRVYNFLWNGALGTESEDTKGRVHPTQKPVRLLEAIIGVYAEGLIVDPYLGSGTTLIACERTGRRCYGIEIEPRYCDVILRRFTAETGQEPELIEHHPAANMATLVE